MGGNIGRPFQYFIIAFSLFLLCFKFKLGCGYGNKVVGCIEREREALLQFKQGVYVIDFVPLSWEGVKCDNQTGHVIMLDLSNQFLNGWIGPSLAELQHLKHLNLRDNFIQGSLPSQLGNLSKLQSLDLSLNSFTGSLSTQFGNLSNLQSLDLRSGNFEHLTCENLDWLSQLPSLTHLDLSGIDLSKVIDWPQAIDKMPSLTELYLSDAKLPPPIINPTLISINSRINSSISTSLAVLDLSKNGLTSSIYPWLFKFSTSSSLVHLDLSSNHLNDSIPDALGNMTALTYLHLSRNHLHGSIPDSFRNLTTLAYLDLSWNQLHGSLLDTLGNMTSLTHLDLSSNQLEGDDISKSLRYLCNLHKLCLSHNNLIGLLEKDFLACSNNTLKTLYLSHNQFRGNPFPHLSEFSRLRKLDLGFNQLNGTLPESIGRLPQLEKLDIRANSLQGMVSATNLFGLSKLRYLDLSFNSLAFNISNLEQQVPLFQAERIKLASCKLGPHFPIWLQTQKSNLVELDISASGISEAIPNWFWNLTLYLSWLNISNNRISGTLPNFTSYPLYLGMDMSSNCLEGSLPESVFNAQWLDLSNNMFTGSISLSCGISYQFGGVLSHLDLSSNRLSGELPKCWEQWTNLIILDLENNNFSGKIKNSIGLLHKMQTLHLRNNSFTGALPSSLKNCRDLSLVDLGKNKLSGTIPVWIGGSLSNLIVFNLRSNEFNGSIPSNLCQLKKIQMLDLSSNNLSGKIPKCLKNLTAMSKKGSSIITYKEVVHYSRIFPSYVDKTLVQWKGKELEYQKTLRFIKNIDFSSNELIGEIPVEITDLVELVSLNLSRNSLTGAIPATIGQLKSLDFLDLSQNRLHGAIPDGLSQIDRLSVLDLSNNTLSGEIPLGTQLQSFKASTYEGNFGLCGPPLLRKCSKDELGEVPSTALSREKEDSQDDANEIWFSGSIVLGFVVGFWGVCGTLLFNSAWRYAYFQFLNKIKDWIYVTIVVNMNRMRRSLQS